MAIDRGVPGTEGETHRKKKPGWIKNMYAVATGALVVSAVYVLLMTTPLSKKLSLSSPDSSNAAVPPPPKVIGFVLPSAKNRAFQAGEKLNYKIVYKGFTVGQATLSVNEGPVINNRPTLQYVSTARSTGLIDSFFKVRDFNSSTVDKHSLFSLSFHQNLHEGRYRAVRNYRFDYKEKTFHSNEVHKGKKIEEEGTLEAPVHDVLSAFFYTRTMRLEPGKTTTLRVYRHGKVKEMRVNVGEELDTIKTPVGEFESIFVEPVVQGDSIFRSKDGRLLIWLSNDERRLPLLIQAAATLGHVSVRLTDSTQ